MRAKQFLSELRRNPEQNQQRDRGYQTVAQLLQGRDLTNIGVSMTELPKLGVNPRSKYQTPVGIYFYPADYYLKQHGRVPFQERAPYVNVFEYEGRVLNTRDYSNQDFEQDLAKLRRLYPQHEANIDYDREQCLDPDVNDFSPLVDIPAGWIWFVVWRLADNILGDMAETTEPQAPAKSVKWNHVMRQLGYDAVVDPGHEVIHKGEPTQGVVLNPRVIRPITQIQNKVGAKAYDPIGQLLIDPDQEHYVRTINKYAKNTPAYLKAQPSSSPKNMAPTQSRIDRMFVRYIEILEQNPKLADPKDILQVAQLAPARLKPRMSQLLAQSRRAEAPATEQ